MKRVRLYSDLMERWTRLVAGVKGVKPFLLGKVRAKGRSYPIWMATTPSEPGKKSICLTGGSHGDEPSGVEAILGVMRLFKARPRLMNHFQFTLFLCVNPFGYEHDTRENASGYDLNRQFSRTRPSAEVRYVREALKGKRFDLSIEFHEDIDTGGFYLFEVCRDKKTRMGEAIVREVAKKYPVNQADVIDGFPACRGVIRPMVSDSRFTKWMERRRKWPQAIYLFVNGTSCCITSETPIHLKMLERVDIHLSVLKTAMKQL